jgi:hypothetical protein
VRRIPTPDSYRIEPEYLGLWLADQPSAQIAGLQQRGEGVAALIADFLFSRTGFTPIPWTCLGRSQALFAGRVLPFDEKAGLIWARLGSRQGTWAPGQRARHDNQRRC